MRPTARTDTEGYRRRTARPVIFLFLYSSTIPARYASAGALPSITDHDSVAVGSRSTQAASPQHRELELTRLCGATP